MPIDSTNARNLCSVQTSQFPRLNLVDIPSESTPSSPSEPKTVNVNELARDGKMLVVQLL
jgi:hypothetical protein